jgi:hypothetical protein
VQVCCCGDGSLPERYGLLVTDWILKRYTAQIPMEIVNERASVVEVLRAAQEEGRMGWAGGGIVTVHSCQAKMLPRPVIRCIKSAPAAPKTRLGIVSAYRRHQLRRTKSVLNLFCYTPCASSGEHFRALVTAENAQALHMTTDATSRLTVILVLPQTCS